jgi:TetR/AcrR family transcriptional repressor of mexJK operon
LSSGTKRKPGRPVDPAKHGAIIAAATDSFFEHGYAASTIEGIAARAGVSKVTVYNHFGDKRALLAAAVGRECERMRGHFAIEADSGGGLRERLRTIGTAMVAFLSRPEMTQFERRIAAETEHEPEIGIAFLDNGPRRMKAAFAILLTHARDSGEPDLPDPELAAEQFASLCKGMGDLERRFGAPPDPARDAARIEGAVEVFLRAYGR